MFQFPLHMKPNFGRVERLSTLLLMDVFFFPETPFGWDNYLIIAARTSTTRTCIVCVQEPPRNYLA